VSAACVECGHPREWHVYGPLGGGAPPVWCGHGSGPYEHGCHCRAFVEPTRGPGRPRLDDKRSPRGGFNDAEWSEVKRKAKAEGMTASAWVRARCGL
jgi:hypothetical protein